MNEALTRQAIFTRLAGYAPLSSLVKGFYSDVPQPDDAGNVADFPFVTYSLPSTLPWDTDETLGAQFVVQVHVWTRTNSSIARAEIYDAVYDCLNRHSLVVAGANTVDCLFTSRDEIDDPDGLTKHGVISFRLTIDEI